jgi:hypothetical protein
MSIRNYIRHSLPPAPATVRTSRPSIVSNYLVYAFHDICQLLSRHLADSLANTIRGKGANLATPSLIGRASSMRGKPAFYSLRLMATAMIVPDRSLKTSWLEHKDRASSGSFMPSDSVQICPVDRSPPRRPAHFQQQALLQELLQLVNR